MDCPHNLGTTGVNQPLDALGLTLLHMGLRFRFFASHHSTMNKGQNISKDLQMILDGLLMGGCFVVSHLLRSSPFGRERFGDIPDISNSFWIMALVIPLSPLLLDLNEYYHHPLSQRYESMLAKIAKSGFWLFLFLSITAIFGRLEIPSRSVLIVFLVLAPITLMARVFLIRGILVRSYKKGKMGERTIIVGSGEKISSFLNGLSEWERLELQISETYDLAKADAELIHKGIRHHAAGRVIFVSPESTENGYLPAACENEGLEVWISAPGFHGIHSAPEFELAGKNRVMAFRRSSSDFWYEFLKRALDILGAASGIIILLIPSLVIAFAVKLTSPGPVIFKQVRSGRRGRRFTILKFRSMVANAPDMHAQLSGQNEMEGPVFKIDRDPRVTPLGEFLRRTSLDEVPQLINVLKGEMSIVGPRPLPDYETEMIKKSAHRRRLSVKPGLTCLWQIRGRNSIRSFDDWVRLDLEYIENASMLLDLWIILQTIPAVLFRRGAK
jgi:exopolysaccharide biosynthesis polyprenyl glycosylphosphotransferase